MKKTLITFLCCAFSFPAFSQDINKFDVLGIRTGMTENDVLNTVKTNIENSFLISKISFQAESNLPASIASMDFCYGEALPGKNREVHNNSITTPLGCKEKILSVSFTRDSSQVFRISRRENYTTNSAPSVDNVLKAVSDKYGAPTTPANTAKVSASNFFAPSNPSSAPALSGSWYMDSKGSTQTNPTCSLALMEIKTNNYYQQYPSNCSSYFNYSVNTATTNSKLAANLHITAINFQLVNSDYARILQKFRASEKIRQEQEAMKSKAVKM